MILFLFWLCFRGFCFCMLISSPFFFLICLSLFFLYLYLCFVLFLIYFCVCLFLSVLWFWFCFSCFSFINVVVFCRCGNMQMIYFFSVFVFLFCCGLLFSFCRFLLSDCALSSHSSYLYVVYLRFQLGLSFSLASSTSLRGGVCRLVGQWTHAAVFKDLGLAFLSRWVARLFDVCLCVCVSYSMSPRLSLPVWSAYACLFVRFAAIWYLFWIICLFMLLSSIVPCLSLFVCFCLFLFIFIWFCFLCFLFVFMFLICFFRIVDWFIVWLLV